MRKELIILSVCCALLSGCRPGSAFRWVQQDGALCLLKGDSLLGRLDVSETEGIRHTARAERVDAETYCITCEFKAEKDVNDARLQVGFTHPSPSSYWMIPAVSYNGNHWGKGQEPKGADENGQWRTLSYRRTPIPGAMYSEGSSYAYATWSEVPLEADKDFSISLQPDKEQTSHRYLWPEEEMPVTYSGRDRFDKGSRKTCPLEKGEKVEMKVYLHIAPLQKEHAAMRSFLEKAWEMAGKPEVEVLPPQRLWELGTQYARESLWAEEGDYRGFSIGLTLAPDGNWQQRPGGKYEIGWCGQNASLAITLLQDYLKNGRQESLEKGMATLDTWSRCALPNGLFVCHYDNILYGNQGPIDACNLGTAAVNYFEACDMARQCGFERPQYEQLAYAICDFVMKDQQPNGCFAKGWTPEGEALYREGTVGCFMVRLRFLHTRTARERVHHSRSAGHLVHRQGIKHLPAALGPATLPPHPGEELRGRRGSHLLLSVHLALALRRSLSPGRQLCRLWLPYVWGHLRLRAAQPPGPLCPLLGARMDRTLGHNGRQPMAPEGAGHLAQRQPAGLGRHAGDKRTLAPGRLAERGLLRMPMGIYWQYRHSPHQRLAGGLARGIPAGDPAPPVGQVGRGGVVLSLPLRERETIVYS